MSKKIVISYQLTGVHEIVHTGDCPTDLNVVEERKALESPFWCEYCYWNFHHILDECERKIIVESDSESEIGLQDEDNTVIENSDKEFQSASDGGTIGEDD